jgi:hypothetical protein
MSWLKMTSEALYLMKGGTNEYLDEVKLKQLGTPDKEEFEFDVPQKWFDGNGAPRVIVVDVGSTEKLNKAVSGFSSDTVFDSVMKRPDWSAAAPKSRFEVNDRPKHIVIHHTTGAPSSGGKEKAKQVVKGIQSSHMNGNGWSDIGYNFLNMVDGVLVEGRSGSLSEAIRGNVVRGAHAGTDEGNASPGVSNEGDFTTATMSAAQWDSLVNMCAALCEACDIDPKNIKGHKDFAPTECPGKWLYSQLQKLQNEVAAKLAS